MPDYQPVFTSLDRLIQEKSAFHNTPGLAIALTDRRALLWQASYGFENVEARRPVTTQSRFEIGSIGKSFSCIVALRLHEAGLLDIHAPVTHYLPWLALQSDFEPITVHHIMSHSAGLGTGIDFTPCARYEVWSLRDKAIAYAPGEHYHYSNVGYKLLGFLLEEVSGRSYGRLLQEYILDPLQMDDSDALTTHDSRNNLATGYIDLYDDRPWHPDHPQIPAPWFEYGGGDGSPVSTTADLASYLRMFLNEGRGESATILSQKSFNMMTTGHIKAGDRHYGYGLTLQERDGRLLIGHNGGTIGYLATMLGDMATGFGVIIFTNGTIHSDKDQIAHYALQLLHAVQESEQLPQAPVTVDPARVENAADYAGVYRSNEKQLTFSAGDDQLLLAGADDAIVLEGRGRDRFRALRADLNRFLLAFQRQEGQIVTVNHGPDIYVKEDIDWSPAALETPEEWPAYVGHYRSHNPWFTNFRICLRAGRLYISYRVYQDDFELPLIELEQGFFQVGESRTPERLRFDTIVNGQALRAEAFGGEYYRYFTP